MAIACPKSPHTPNSTSHTVSITPIQNPERRSHSPWRLEYWDILILNLFRLSAIVYRKARQAGIWILYFEILNRAEFLKERRTTAHRFRTCTPLVQLPCSTLYLTCTGSGAGAGVGSGSPTHGLY